MWAAPIRTNGSIAILEVHVCDSEIMARDHMHPRVSQILCRAGVCGCAVWSLCTLYSCFCMSYM